MHNTLAFADDIGVKGTLREIKLKIKDIESWCRRNGLQLNKSKSAIMYVKVDRRTKFVNGHLKLPLR